MEKIAENIWKLNVDSNVYLLDLDEKIIVDTGPRSYHDIVKKELSSILPLEKISMVIFTHLHYDHTGNFDLFPKAKFYASREEISSFKKNKVFAVLDPALAAKLDININALESLPGFDILPTPGHTGGSMCLFYKKEKILFSGDTLFFNGVGRYDLPNSLPEKMESSLKKLKRLNYKILAPGHDY
jgi:hydroxyacylglutathione hydrolase